MVHRRVGGKPDTGATRGIEQTAHKTPPRSPYLRTTLSQLSVMVVGAPLAFLLGGASSALSLLSGAACAVVPQAYFALRMAMAARHSARQAARMGLAAEGGKFLLSAVSFALVFAVVKPAHPGLVFLGFGILWLVQLIDTIRLLRA